MIQDTDNNGLIIKKASAGSGKTFNLALRYLRLILSDSKPDAYRRILAVTFTKAAANEMKTRIIDNLTGIAVPALRSADTQTVLTMLTKQTRLSEAELTKRAKKILKVILQRYTDFSVSTLDSFSHRIVRSFSFDLDLASSFQVELDQDVMMNTAIGELFQEVGVAALPTEVLSQFIMDQMDDDKFKRPDALLETFSDELFADYRHRYIKQLEKYEVEELEVVKNEYKNSWETAKNALISLGENIETLLDQHQVSAEAFPNRSVFKYAQKLKEANISFITLKTFTGGIDKGEWVKKSNKDQAEKSRAEAIEDEITEMMVEAQAWAEKLVTTKLMFHSMYQTISLKLLLKHVETLKKSTQTLHISDFNKTIGQVVATEPVPFIYERLGEFYRHFLVDEFQDTSEVQWTNLVPLTGEALSKKGSVFLVGDAKQSIYRWRGGDVSQFVNLPQLPHLQNTPAVSDWQTTFTNALRENDNAGLETNRRSAQNIIQFNNELFEMLAAQRLSGDFEAAYADVAQKSLENKPGGYLRFELLQKRDLGGSKPRDLNAETGKPIIHEKVRNLIIELTQGENAQYQGKDILILTRRNAEANEISTYLKSEGLTTYTDADVQLGQIPETAFTASLINAAYFPKEKYYRAQALLHGKKLRNIHPEGSLPMDKSSLNVRVGEFFKLFNLPDLTARRYTAFELFEIIYGGVFGQNPNNAALLALGSEIHKFAAKHGDNPGAFLKRWNEDISQKSPDTSPQPEFIRVMTIHKSKGLQAPVIIMPYLNSPLKIEPHKSNSWIGLTVNKEGEEAKPLSTFMRINKNMKLTPSLQHYYEQEEEELNFDAVNNLYVAFTRAEEALYGFAYKQDATSGIHPYLEQMSGVHIADDEIYTFGEPVSRKEKKFEDETPKEFGNIHFYNTRDKLRTARVDLPMSNPGNKPKSTLGSIIHYIMERLPASESVDDLLRIVRLRFRLSDSDFLTIQQSIESILKDKELEPLIMSKDAFTERELYDAQNKKLLRPDKVVKTDKGYVLIDYKTGLVGAKAEKQLNEYAHALEQAGYPVAERKIVAL